MRFLVCRLAAFAVLAFSISLSVSGQFLELDPTLDWQVLETRRFNIIYHEGLEDVAQEAALVSEEAYEFWVKELRYAVPTKINIILADPADFAVGAANPFGDVIAGVSSVRVFNEWLNPQNPSWLDDVLYHEIGHVFDLTKVHGLSKTLRPFLGPLLIPNASKPGTIIEGIPIYFELKRAGASRSNSSRDAMYFRAQVLENKFIPLDQMSTSYDRKRWPSEYMLSHDWGAWFTRFIAEKYGDDKLVLIDEINADAPLTIFSLGLVNDFEGVLKRALGVSKKQLEADWHAWLKAQFDPQIEKIKREGGTPSQKLSRLTYWNNDPAWAPDSKAIFYYHKDSDREASIRRITPDGKKDEFITTVPFELDFFRPPFFATAPQVSPDGKTLLYTKHEIFDNHYTYADLFLWDIEKKEEKQLTEQARAYHPVFFPDGKKILFAQQRSGVESPVLALYELDTERIVPFKNFPQGTLIDSFAVSPDGKKIALTLWKIGGYQDLYLMSTEGGELTAITQDKAGDFDPEWSPDGNFVLFSAERDGVYNLYAYGISDGQFFKVTNVLTGAFAPAVSPDAKKIAFISYSTKGYELHLMDYAPASWQPVGLEKESVPEWRGWRPANLTPKSYRPEKFLAPRLWLPIPNPTEPALLFVGFDPLDHHSYTLYAGYDLKGQQPVLAFDARIEFALQTDRRFFGWLEDAVNSLAPQFNLHLERTAAAELIGRAQIELVFSRKLGRVQTLALGVEQRQSDQSLQKFRASFAESFEGGSDLMRIGRALALRAEFAFKNNQWQKVFYIRQQEQIQLPLGFANRLSRLTVLGRDELEPLKIGGPSGPWPLRGFPANFKAATQVIYTGWEFELPLLSLERGIGLWSIFFDRVAGLLFTEAVRLSTEVLGEGDFYTSYGGELRLTIVLGYGLPIQLRLGVAQGQGQPKPEFYVDVGGGF